MSYYNDNYNHRYTTKKPGAGRTKKTDAVRFREYQFDDFLSDVGNLEIARLFGALEARAKLKVGNPGDKVERDADRIADAVVKSGQSDDAASIQNKAGLSESSPTTPPSQNSAELSGSGERLSKNLRAYFEPRFGVDLGNVRIHTDKNANRLSAYVHARAFALGNDIAFGENQYKPETTEGKKLIAHELAHVMQEDDGTIRRAEEKMWTLHKDGTIEFGGGPDLWVDVEYDVPVVENKKIVKDKFEKKTGKKLVCVAKNRTISGSLVEWLGTENALEEARKLISGDPARPAAYNTEEKKQTVTDSFSDKKRAESFLLGALKFDALTADERNSLLANLIMDASGMKYDPQKGWQGNLKLKAGKHLSKYFNYDYKAQFDYLKGIGDASTKGGFDKWYSNRRNEELASIRGSSLYKAGYITEADLADTNLNLTQLEFEELEALYALHRIGDFKDEAVKQKFVDMYMYTLRKKYIPRYGERTKCDLMLKDFLGSSSHKRVLDAIYATEGSNEVEQVLKYVAGGNKKKLEEMKQPSSTFSYENDEILVFSSHEYAQKLANENMDVAIFGKYLGDDNKTLLPHFSMVAPSNISFNEKSEYLYYSVFGLDIQPYSKYFSNPNVPSAKGTLLAQVGTANGMLNYFWAYNNQPTKIEYKNNTYSGIVYVYFKRK